MKLVTNEYISDEEDRREEGRTDRRAPAWRSAVLNEMFTVKQNWRNLLNRMVHLTQESCGSAIGEAKSNKGKTCTAGSH